MAAASLVVGLKSLAVMLAGCRKGLFSCLDGVQGEAGAVHRLAECPAD